MGRIADRGPEYVSAREWMRICFELLELLKAHKKAIRRATVNTFGYIAKAIGCVCVMTIINNVIFCKILISVFPHEENPTFWGSIIFKKSDLVGATDW